MLKQVFLIKSIFTFILKSNVKVTRLGRLGWDIAVKALDFGEICPTLTDYITKINDTWTNNNHTNLRLDILNWLLLMTLK